MMHIPSQCPICNGKVEPGTTTFAVDLKSGLIVVRNVPALICIQCGEEWLEDSTAIQLEEITARAKAQNTQLEVVSMG
jgi:hypothetical protein